MADTRCLNFFFPCKVSRDISPEGTHEIVYTRSSVTYQWEKDTELLHPELFPLWIRERRTRESFLYFRNEEYENFITAGDREAQKLNVGQKFPERL